MLKKERTNLFIAYTLLFLAMCLIIFKKAFFSDFILLNEGDALSQHFKAFRYYGIHLRTILYNIFILHIFEIPQFDITLGEGSDILQTLCYYVIGDPFALIAVFSPENYAHIAYQFSALLRLFLAGLSFIYMCSYFEHKNKAAILTGCICYIFVPTTIMYIPGHIFFLNPFIFFPLLIVGINKIINKESPLTYIFTLFLAMLSNFYFLYMLSILLIIYTIIKAILTYRNNFKEILALGGKCILYAILAFFLAGFLLIPELYIYISDSRSSFNSLTLFYDFKTYIKLPIAFSDRFPIQALFAIFLLFTLHNKNSNKQKLLIICFCFCIIAIFIPIVSQVLNAMSYPTDRWAFSFTLLCSYIVVYNFENLCTLKLQKKTLILVLLWASYFILISFIAHDKEYLRPYALTQMLLGIIFIAIIGHLSTRKKKPYSQKNIICLIFFAITLCSLKNNFDLISNKTITESLYNNSAEQVKKIANTKATSEFFRYAKTGIETQASDENVNMVSGISSTAYYWSLTNKKIIDFRKQLEIADQQISFRYNGYDTRPIVSDLTNVLYFYKKSNSAVPNLYQYSNTNSENIFINDNFIPFGYTYQNYILRKDFEKLNGVEKEAVLAKAAVLEKNTNTVDYIENMNTEVSQIEFMKEYNDEDLIFSKNEIITKKDNAVLKLHLNGELGSNVFLRMENIEFEAKNKKNPEWVTLDVSTNYGYNRSIDIDLPNYRFFSGTPTNSMNLGFCDNNHRITEIEIIFSDEGIYKFTDFKLLSLPTEKLTKDIKQLSSVTLKNIDFKTNSITGNISTENNLILILSIPYLRGWKAKVDGKQQELLQANIMHMALPLEKGNHKVELSYKTPFLNIGLLISMLGILLSIAIFCISLKKKRHLL